MADVIEYQRIDLNITIRYAAKKQVLARLARSGIGDNEQMIPADYFRDWSRHPETAVTDLVERLGLIPGSPLLHNWPTDTKYNQRRRLLLDITDRELSGLPWEAALAAEPLPIPVDVIARTSPVLPHYINSPMTLPLRVLQVGNATPIWSASSMSGLFGPDNIHLVPQGIQVAHCAFDGIEKWCRGSQWPWATIVLFDLLPTLEKSRSLFLVDEPERPGTLGWLARIVDSWQTRLVILYCYSAAQAVQARRLAAEIVQKGGPAFLVCRQANPQMRTDMYWLLNDFFHDRPLDDLSILAKMLPVMPTAHLAQENPISLFIGAGRAESLRISPLLQTFVDRASSFSSSRHWDVEHWWPAMYNAMTNPSLSQTPIKRRHALWQMGEKLDEVRLAWKTTDFLSESHGFKLAASTMEIMRSLGHMTEPVSWEFALAHEVGHALLGSTQKKTPANKDRYVISSLFQQQNGKVNQLPQMGTILQIGQTYHLGIQIGPRIPQIITLGDTALVEEVFKWQPDMPGVWVEVGLTGLDFEVLGNPVQSLWLPNPDQEDSPIITDLIYFSVVPNTTTVAQLRFTLYYKNDVIQSFRLAALTTDQPTTNEIVNGRSLLAAALEVPETKVGNRDYLTRLEYSITNNLSQIKARPARALSIIANHHQGQAVVTTKGTELFSVQTPGDLPKRVAYIRKKLDEISSPDGEFYNFGTYQGPNMGNKDKLTDALFALAEEGWKLYRSISTPKGRAQIKKRLLGDGEIIHVAHVFLDKTIPWQLMYGRQFNPRYPNHAHEVCQAVMPDAEGNIPDLKCGQNPQCVLHKDQLQKRKAAGAPPIRENTIVCPWHFWGFRHQIEAPAQQTHAGKSQELYNCILATEKKLHLLLGINQTLDTKEHLTRLEKIVGDAGLAASWPEQPFSEIGDILDAMEVSELGLIYFLCHARGGDIEGQDAEPHLEFNPPDGIILAYDLPDVIWKNHPLIFLNGCHTAGFSPRSISPFVQFMSQQEAGGVIGTEISVFDSLATEMAERFMQTFLTGMGAGEALLLARRQLLAQDNPLGLAYTLYGAADLKVDLSDNGCTGRL